MHPHMEGLLFLAVMCCVALLYTHACLELLGLPPFPVMAFHATLLGLYMIENWSLFHDLTKTSEPKQQDISSLLLENLAINRRIKHLEAETEKLQRQIKGYNRLKVIYTSVWPKDEPARLANKAFSASWSEDSTRPRPI